MKTLIDYLNGPFGKGFLAACNRMLTMDELKILVDGANEKRCRKMMHAYFKRFPVTVEWFDYVISTKNATALGILLGVSRPKKAVQLRILEVPSLRRVFVRHCQFNKDIETVYVRKESIDRKELQYYFSQYADCMGEEAFWFCVEKHKLMTRINAEGLYN